jgi:hypothetical protein
VRRRALLLAFLVLCAVVAAGCGSSHSTATQPPTSATASSAPPPAAPPPTSAKPATSTSPSTRSGAPALQGEAASAATGDIPDNQVFLVFGNGAAGYSIKYPEGWAQQGNGRRVVFRDTNNIVRILVANGALPTPAAARRELAAQSKVKVTTPPEKTTISGAPAIKVVYTTESPPNPVTGKRVTLTVDRYYLAQGGKVAVVDLGTPVGVDNVDAYRLMIESFRWR